MRVRVNDVVFIGWDSGTETTKMNMRDLKCPKRLREEGHISVLGLSEQGATHQVA